MLTELKEDTVEESMSYNSQHHICKRNGEKHLYFRDVCVHMSKCMCVNSYFGIEYFANVRIPS